MAQEEDKKEEEFRLLPTGEAEEWMTLEQARVRAIEHAYSHGHTNARAAHPDRCTGADSTAGAGSGASSRRSGPEIRRHCEDRCRRLWNYGSGPDGAVRGEFPV